MVEYPPAEHVLTPVQMFDRIRVFVAERISLVAERIRLDETDEYLAGKNYAYLSVLNYIDELSE